MLSIRSYAARTGRTLLMAGALGGALSACASSGAKPAAEPESAVRVLPPDDTPPPPPVDGMPSGFRTAFTAADARARAAVYSNQCVATIVRMRAAGSFGPAAAAPKLLYCERTADGVPLGGVFDVDSAFTRARRLMVVRLDGARPRYTGAVDSVRVAQEAKLVRDITREVTPGMTKLGRVFRVVPMLQADGTLEAWVIPWPSLLRTAVLGGDIAMVRAADGRLRRIVDRTATWKVVPVATSGPVVLTSTEHDVPAVADLVVARGLADQGREVTVTTAVARSALVSGIDPTSGARLVWQHTLVTT